MFLWRALGSCYFTIKPNKSIFFPKGSLNCPVLDIGVGTRVLKQGLYVNPQAPLNQRCVIPKRDAEYETDEVQILLLCSCRTCVMAFDCLQTCNLQPCSSHSSLSSVCGLFGASSSLSEFSESAGFRVWSCEVVAVQGLGGRSGVYGLRMLV